MRFFLLFLVGTLPFLLKAQPPRPATATWVVDEANMLSGTEKDFLREQILYLEQQSSVELVIATIPSLNGADLEDYAQDWAESWGIGKADKDNGLLLLVALQDRKMRLHTGYGLEAQITDLSAKNLLDYNLKPAFRREAYFEGFTDFLTQLFIQLRVAPSEALLKQGGQKSGEALPPIARRDSSGQIILPIAVPPYRPPSVWDPDQVLTDSVAGLLDKKFQQIQESGMGYKVWWVFREQLPSPYKSLQQYTDSLQAGWFVAYPAAEGELLMVYWAEKDSFTFRRSENAYIASHAHGMDEDVLQPLLNAQQSDALDVSIDYFLQSIANNKYSLRRIEAEVFRRTQPEAYAAQQAQKAEIARFDYWLNWGQGLVVVMLLPYLFLSLAALRTKGYARRVARQSLLWMRRLYLLLFPLRLIGVILHPEPFGDILLDHFLIEAIVLLIALMFSFALLGGGGGRGSSFSGGSSFGGSSFSGGSSFGGGSFGGGGASSSW